MKITLVSLYPAPGWTLALLVASSAPAFGALYWDTVKNNTGVQSGPGVWSTSSSEKNWNPLMEGNGSETAWSQGADAVFLTSGASAVTVSGTVNVNSITFSGTGYTIGGAALTLTGAGITADAAATISAPLGGNVGLTKFGTSTLTLSGANSYTGTTSITAGTLALTGTGSISTSSVINVGTGGILNISALTSGMWTVGGGQTLAGVGSVTGATTISGTHAPGTAGTPGTQTFSSSLAYTSGSIFDWDLNATTTDPGSGAINSGSYDKVNATGAVTGTSVFTVALGINTFSSAFWNTNKTWSDIFTKGAGSSTLSSLFPTFGGAGVATNGTVLGQGQFSFTGGNTLSWTAVPEVSNILTGLVMVAGCLRRKRC